MPIVGVIKYTDHSRNDENDQDETE